MSQLRVDDIVDAAGTGAPAFSQGVTISGTTTLSSLAAGLVHSNGSGVLSSSLLVNADVDAAAALALTKLAATTSSRALVSDSSGFIAASATTSTEIGYVSGVTSSIQTQLNTKAPTASPTFTGTVTAASLTATGTLTMGGNDLTHQITGRIIQRTNNTTDNGISSYRFNPDSTVIADAGTHNFDTGVASFSGLVIIQQVTNGLTYFVRCDNTTATLLTAISADTNIAVAKSTGAGTDSRLAVTNNSGAPKDFRCFFLIASNSGTD